MLPIPRPLGLYLRVRPPQAVGPPAGLTAAVVAAVLLWQLILVAAAAFFHYGDPARNILSALELPSLMALYPVFLERFGGISSSGGILIGASVFLLLRKRSPLVSLLPLAAVLLSLGGLVHAGEPLTLARIERDLRCGYPLCLAAALVLFDGLRRPAGFHLPRRPVFLTLAAVAGSASIFYFLLEASTKGEWSDFTGRFTLFLIASLALTLLRGPVLEPLVARGAPRSLTLGAHWILADFVVPFLIIRLLALHAGNIFPFLLMTGRPPSSFFDPLGIWVGFLLLSLDLAALRWTGGSIEAFGKRFSSLDTPGVLALVPFDRLLQKRLGPRTRFLVAGLIVLGIPAAIVGTYRGDFLFYLLGPSVYALCLYLWVVLVSLATFLVAGGRAPARAPRWAVPALAGAMASVALALTLLGHGSVERTLRLTFQTFREVEHGKFRTLIAGARRFENRYQAEKARPSDFPEHNLVLLTSDSLRAANLGCYGYRRPDSPRMDALAADSIRFTNAFTAATHTYSSISSLLRGDLRDRPVPDLEGTWLRILVEGGAFAKAVIYNSVMLHLPESPGVEGIRFVPEFDFEERDRFRQDLDAVKDRPFLIWVHGKGTHKLFPAPHAPDVFGSGPMDVYDNNVRYFDSFVGFTLDLLREKGLDSRTLVVVSSDHGEMFGEHGQWSHSGDTFYDPLIRIPLIVHVPGLSGRAVETFTALTDLGPTFLEVFGFRLAGMPSWIRSRRRTLLGEEEEPETRVLPLTSLHFQSVGIHRSDGMKFFITHREEFLLNARIDPSERQNLARFAREAEAECRRQCYEMFELGVNRTTDGDSPRRH